MRLLVSILCVASLLFATSAFAIDDVAYNAKASSQGSLSATAASAELKLNARHILLINDGANEVFVKLNSTSAATVSDFQIKPTEGVVLDVTEGQKIYNVRYICSPAEAATVRYIAWD